MLLTKPQLAVFWRLWTEACEVQGWTGSEREERRREALSECGFSSLTEVDRRHGFDLVKAHVQRLAHRIEGGTDAAFPRVRQMRQHLWVIEHRLFPELREAGRDPEAYVASIIRDRHWGIHWRSIGSDPVRGPDRAKELLYTLSRAARAMRDPETKPKVRRKARVGQALPVETVDAPF